MKLIEKLSMQYAQTQINPHLNLNDNVEYAFEAGFEAGVDTMLKKLMVWGYGSIVQAIRAIGPDNLDKNE